MNTKKRAALSLVVLAVFAAIVAVWFFSQYTVLMGGIYNKDAEIIDLRGKDISAEKYEAISMELPGRDILWDIPFQGKTYSQETDVLAVATLTQEDADMLRHFPKLQQLDARECRDYEVLEAVIRENPQLLVLCSAELSGTSYDQDSTAVWLGSCTGQELAAVKCLTRLEAIQIGGGMEPEVYAQLQEYCQQKEIELQFAIGGEIVSQDVSELVLNQPTDEDLAAAALLPQLKTLHLADPVAAAETVLALGEKLPGTNITWEKNVLGMTFDSDATQIDLTGVLSRVDGADPEELTPYQRAANEYVLGDPDPLPSAVSIRYEELVDRTPQTKDIIAEVEAAMAYFPNAEKLVMAGCFLDNEAMSELRETHRADYKVSWTVKCGRIAPRTDATYFMPAKYNVYSFSGEDGQNLKYCEDVVCIDVGHMNIDDIGFTAYMPELKYMILGETIIKDISPLANCKKLVFLEIQRSRVEDLTPLLQCTALEDLNIGTLEKIDLNVVKQMTWLKTLYMATFRKNLKEMQEALPDCNIKAPTDTTVLNNGWRELPNYYAMRDALLMYYME